MQQLQHTLNNYHYYFLNLLMLFYFLDIQENLYMNPPLFKLIFKDDNTINQYYQN